MTTRRLFLKLPAALLATSAVAAASVPAPPVAPSPLEITHGLYQEVLAHQAANPTDVVGVTQRVTELLRYMLQEYGPESDTIDRTMLKKTLVTSFTLRRAEFLSMERLGSIDPAIVPIVMIRNLFCDHRVFYCLGANDDAREQWRLFVKTYNDKLPR